MNRNKIILAVSGTLFLAAIVMSAATISKQKKIVRKLEEETKVTNEAIDLIAKVKEQLDQVNETLEKNKKVKIPKKS